MRILLADQDQELSAGTARSTSDWHQVQVVRDAQHLVERLTYWHPDVLVLGTGLGAVDTADVAQRAATVGTALVLLLSHGRRDEELVAARDLDVQGCIEKPVSSEVLLARVDAIARRRLERVNKVVRVGDLTVDPTWHQVTWHERTIEMTRHQFRILHVLALHAGQPVAYRQLIDYAWAGVDKPATVPFNIQVQRLVNHVARIRAKLRAAAPHANPIVAVAGRGYRLTG